MQGFVQIGLIFLLGLWSTQGFAVASSTDHAQGALWHLIEKGQISEANALEQQLSEVLKTAPLKQLTPIRVVPGFSPSYIAQLPDNVYAVVKESDPHLPDSHVREMAAYRVDRLLGLNMIPLTVARQIDGKSFSLQLYYPQEQKIFAQKDTDFLLRVGDVRILDVLIANGDRNVMSHHNVITGKEGRLVAIDHGRTFLPFEITDSARDISFYLEPTAEFQKRLLQVTDGEVQEALKDILPSEMTRALLKRLALLKEALGLRTFEAKPFVTALAPWNDRRFATPPELQEKIFFDAFALEKMLRPVGQQVLMGGELLLIKQHPQFAAGVVLRNWFSYEEPLRRQLLNVLWSKQFMQMVDFQDAIVEDILKLDKTKGFQLRPKAMFARFAEAMAPSAAPVRCSQIFAF